MSAELSLCVLNVIRGGVPTSGRLSAFTALRFSRCSMRAGVGVEKRSRLRTVPMRIAFHKRRALAGRPVGARYRRMSVEGRGPTIRGGLRPVPPSLALRRSAGRAQPGSCQVAAGNPEGAA